MDTDRVPFHVTVGKRLAGKLRERQITYEQLGRMCGWSTSSISRRIRGETPLSLADLECLEHTTGISIASLLIGDGELMLNQSPFGQTVTSLSAVTTARAGNPITAPTTGRRINANGHSSKSHGNGQSTPSRSPKNFTSNSSSATAGTAKPAEPDRPEWYPKSLPLPWLDLNQQPFGLRPDVLGQFMIGSAPCCPVQARRCESDLLASNWVKIG